MPMAPEAPGRFSTTTVWPRALPSSTPIRRATVSLVPPAACGTMILMGWSAGHSALAAAAPSRPAPSSRIRKTVFMRFPFSSA
ncbi:Uncharacterised protein [Bordetella pertussis]|nr:Uncharacterised protein [Bordetella pertussis]CFV96119.1 Uncharacterised protein [Bordetella pertussis]